MIERSILALLLVGLLIGVIAVVKPFTTAILFGTRPSNRGMADALGSSATEATNHQIRTMALQPRPNLSGAGFYPAPRPYTRGLWFLVQVASYTQFPVTRPLSTYKGSICP
jgi:hypothetical protein